MIYRKMILVQWYLVAYQQTPGIIFHEKDDRNVVLDHTFVWTKFRYAQYFLTKVNKKNSAICNMYYIDETWNVFHISNFQSNDNLNHTRYWILTLRLNKFIRCVPPLYHTAYLEKINLNFRFVFVVFFNTKMYRVLSVVFYFESKCKNKLRLKYQIRQSKICPGDGSTTIDICSKLMITLNIFNLFYRNVTDWISNFFIIKFGYQKATTIEHTPKFYRKIPKINLSLHTQKLKNKISNIRAHRKTTRHSFDMSRYAIRNFIGWFFFCQNWLRFVEYWNLVTS